MYEIFESQVDNIEISREYNYLRNYKIEEINGGGGTAGYSSHLTACIFLQQWMSSKNR